MQVVIGGIFFGVVLAWFAVPFITVPLALVSVPVGVYGGLLIVVVSYLHVLVGEDVVGPGELRADRPARAPHRHWDPAWPSYLMVQLDRDMTASLSMSCDMLMAGAGVSWRYLRRDEARFVVLASFSVLLAAVPLVLSVVVGVFAGWAAIGILLELLLFGPRLIGLAMIAFLRSRDWAVRWWRGAAATCPKCGWVAELPAFHCDGSRCREVHRDIRPGRLGILWRTCDCGQRLPTTVLRAAKLLPPSCPQCDQLLPPQAGTLPDARIVLSGLVGEGKSALVRSAVLALTPDGDPESFGAPDSARVTTLHFDGRRFVHLIEMDGEVLTEAADAERLWRLGTARRHLLVLDAKLLFEHPEDMAELDSGLMGLQLPYQRLIEQMNRHGGRPSRCSLAIVVSMVDGSRINGRVETSDAVRAKLCAGGLKNLVLAAERDFGVVRYFWVRCEPDAAGGTDVAAPFEWLLARHGHGVGTA
jgi:hypothetical protein